MRLHCNRCSSLIAAADINIQAMMAKCSQCASVFSFADSVPGSPAASLGISKPSVEKPRGIELAYDDVSLRITRRWLGPQHFALAFFCAAWDSFLIFWYSHVPLEAPWLFTVFPIGHVAVGVWLTYYVLCGFLNKTHIRISRSLLTVRHGPLPWVGNKEVSVQGLVQVFCQMTVHSSSRNRQPGYSVQALREDGSRVELVSGLLSLDHAQYIEQQVERYLGIKDSPVHGEAKPSGS